MFSYAMLVYVAYNGGRVLYDHRNILSQYSKNIEWVSAQASQASSALVHFICTVFLYTLYCTYMLCICTYAMFVYSVCVHYSCSTTLIHCVHMYTGLVDSLHPLVFYTLYIHWSSTLSAFTGLLHSLHPLIFHTLYIHWYSRLSTSTGTVF